MGVPGDIGAMKVLLAVDGSNLSRSVLEKAPSLVNLAGAELYVLCAAPSPVVPDVAGLMTPPYTDYTLLAQQVKAEAEASLDDAVAQLRKIGFEPRPVLVERDPADAILAFLREEKCDLAVVGSHGRTGIKRLILGSVSARIVNEAPCPVLLIKDPAAKDD
jgi:nucleotide-binding universal stress UspA family protein